MLTFLRHAPRPVFVFLAGNALFGLIMGAYQALSALHLLELGADARLLGLFGALSGIVGFALSPFIGMLADYRRRAVWLSAVATALGGYFLLFLSRSVGVWWIAQMLISCGITTIFIVESAVLARLSRQGLVPMINSIPTNITGPEERGRAFAWRMVGCNVGGAGASSAAGYVLSSPFPLGVYGGGVAVSVATVLYVLRLNTEPHMPCINTEPRSEVAKG